MVTQEVIVTSLETSETIKSESDLQSDMFPPARRSPASPASRQADRPAARIVLRLGDRESDDGAQKYCSSAEYCSNAHSTVLYCAELCCTVHSTAVLQYCSTVQSDVHMQLIAVHVRYCLSLCTSHL